MRHALRSLVPWAGIAACYTLAAILFTWPLAAHLGTHVWGDRFDTWTTLWLVWFLHHAVSTGTISEVTQLISYPSGYNLWSFGHMALQLLAVPLIGAGLSVTAAYNVLGIGGLAVTATGGHALGYKLGEGHLGGALAACVVAFNPLLYGEFSVGSIELVAAFFLPLYVLCLVRLAERPTLGRAALLALVLALTGPFNWYYSIFCVLLTGPLVALLAVGRPWATNKKNFGLIAIAGLSVLLVTMPVFHKIRRETPTRIELRLEDVSGDALDRVRAFHDARLDLRQLDRDDLERFDAAQVVTNSTTLRNLVRCSFTVNPLDSTPGRLALALALVGLVAAPRRGWRWAALALLFALLMLGPFPRWDAGTAPGDGSTTLPLPYYFLYNYVPYFSKAYRPYRLGIVTITALAAMASLAGPWLRGLVGARWGAVVVALLVVLFASQPHWAEGRPSARGLSATAIPSVYRQLDALPEGALIELPLLYQPVHLGASLFQYYQVAHERPLLNNNQLIRIDDLLALQELARGNELVNLLLGLDHLSASEPVVVRAADVRELVEMGFGLVAIHESYPADPAHLAGRAEFVGMLPGRAFRVIDELLGPALLEQDGVRFYDLRRGLGADDAVLAPPELWLPGNLDALDAFSTGHLITLLGRDAPSGSRLDLGSAPVGSSLRTLSLWAKGVQDSVVVIHFLDERGVGVGEPMEHSISPLEWRRLVAIAPAGAVSVELANPGDAVVEVSLTRAWLELEPAAVPEPVSEEAPQ